MKTLFNILIVVMILVPILVGVSFGQNSGETDVESSELSGTVDEKQTKIGRASCRERV